MFKEHINDFDSKICNKVLLCYWLSHDKTIIELVNKLNKLLWYMDDKTVYEYFYEVIPKKRRYLRWTKALKKDKDRDIDGELEELRLKFNLSTEELNLYRS